jgi:hypothetical protein
MVKRPTSGIEPGIFLLALVGLTITEVLPSTIVTIESVVHRLAGENGRDGAA